MDSKHHETRGTTGESSAYAGGSDYQVTEFEVHEHTTVVSQLGKEPECREALDRLYHYLDGELTESRRRQIKEHLETCMPCLEAFDFEAELKLLIARRCRDDVPAHLRLRVVQALTEASRVGLGDGEAESRGREGTSGWQAWGRGGSEGERTDARSEGVRRTE